jgi:pectate lyase
MNVKLLAAALVLLVLVTTAGVRADEPAKADNPLYTGWAKFKVGSNATYKADVPGPDGKATVVAMMLTLKELTADTATVEMQIVDHTETIKIPAKVPADDAKKTGAAEITIDGKTYKCTVYNLAASTTGKTDGDRVTASMNEDVAGGLVKVVTKDAEGKEATITLSSFEAK